MTKEEKIKEAWGEYYDGVKQYLSDRGFPEVNRYSRNYIDKNISKTNQDRIAEKLIIINHNNGWIKIESEDDLPKHKGNYFVYTHNKEIETVYADGDISSMEHTSKSWIRNFTHYQPIEKPKPPIY